MRLPHHRDIAQRLLRFTVGEFGVAFDLTMERFFAQVEVLPQVFDRLRISKGRSYRQPETAISLFKQALAAVFSESLMGSSSGTRAHRKCGFHNRLMGTIDASDAVISFNYDCVVEESMRLNCRFWDPTRSYYIPVKNRDPGYWTYQVPKAVRLKHVVPLLKMHGSMNWTRSGRSMSLLQEPYSIRADYEIVPPQWQKDVLASKSIFRPIWQEARKRIELAKCLVIAGYSAPLTDLLAQTLLRCRNRPAGKTVGTNFLEVLVIANPDRAARRHLLNLMRNSIDDRTRVLMFENLELCCEHLVPELN
jgi:hypothetical protein